MKYIYSLHHEGTSKLWYFKNDPRKTMSAVDLAKFITKETEEYPYNTADKFNDWYGEKYGDEEHIKLEMSIRSFAAAFYKWIEDQKFTFKKIAENNNIFVNKEKLILI